jgi:hypothetical protein
MRVREALGALLTVTLAVAAVGVAHGQQAAPPVVIAGYETEALAPGVWRIVDDGTGSSLHAREIRAGPDGSHWVLSDEGASELGVGLASPTERGVDRLLAVDAEGKAWLRYRAVNQEMVATWDGRAWTDITGPRRTSALQPDPLGAPGVIRDMALGPERSMWVVAGEQDSPRWERFTIERLDGDAWTTWAIGDGLPELRCGKNCGDASRVVATDDGGVWVSVDQGGLLWFDGSGWEAVRPLGGDIDHPVAALVGEAGGVVWADVEREPGGRARARFDGERWDVPDHAQPPADAPADDRPMAVGRDGTLWTVGRSEGREPILWAIEDRGRRAVADLGACRTDTDPGTPRCLEVGSLTIDPGGLVWAILLPSEPSARWEAPAGILVIDPETALGT